MPESSSFIPKRNPGQTTRSVRRYNFVLLTIISYALFCAAPLASAALFIYQRHTENQFNASVARLDEAISDFSETDLNRVVIFDKRLEIAKKLMNNHVSMLSLIKILETGTAETVKFNGLEIKRTSQSSLTVKGDLETTAIDGVLFQRSVYNTNTEIASSSLSNIKVVDNTATTTSVGTVNSSKKKIKLSAEFIFDTDKILYTPLFATVNESPDSTPVDTVMESDTTTTTTPSETREANLNDI